MIVWVALPFSSCCAVPVTCVAERVVRLNDLLNPYALLAVTVTVLPSGIALLTLSLFPLIVAPLVEVVQAVVTAL